MAVSTARSSGATSKRLNAAKWKDVPEDRVTKQECPSCGAPVLRALVGRVAALDVVVDPDPIDIVTEVWYRQQGLLTWGYKPATQWTEHQLHWREAVSNHKEGQVVVPDHVCPDKLRGMLVFVTPSHNDEVPRVDKGIYAGRPMVPHPVTGEIPENGWYRVTSMISCLDDRTALEAWLMRNVAAGMALSPDLVADAAGLDIKADREVLDDICNEAKRRAGGNLAADRGTKWHTYSEHWDRGHKHLIPEELLHRFEEYGAALAEKGLTPDPNLMERSTMATQVEAFGTADRLLRKDGRLFVGDLKTGKSVKNGVVAAQLAIYARGFSEHGQWLRKERQWAPMGEEVDLKVGYLIHMPAEGKGCKVVPLDLEAGWEAAKFAFDLRKWRLDQKRFIIDDASIIGTSAVGDWYLTRIEEATSRAQLEEIARIAKHHGNWCLEYRGAAMKKLQVNGW